jgi:hypothetical protein
MHRAHLNRNHLAVAVAVAAAFGVIAAAPASAQEQTCANESSWVILVERQGVPSPQQTSGTACTSSLACPPMTDIRDGVRLPGLGLQHQRNRRPRALPSQQNPSTAARFAPAPRLCRRGRTTAATERDGK